MRNAVVWVALVLLALPATAGADSEVVPDSVPAATTGFSCDTTPSAPCLFIQDTINGSPVRIPFGGVITGWEVEATDQVALRVYRRTATTPAGQLEASLVDGTGDVDGGGNYDVNPGIPVQAGDLIGVLLRTGSSLIHGSDPGDGSAKIFEAGATDDIDTSDYTDLAMVSKVTVETDGDGDGLGDETQDPTPPGSGNPGNTNTGGGSTSVQQPVISQPCCAAPDVFAAIRKKGPGVKIAGSATATSRGTVALTVTNPYAFPLRGKLSIAAARTSASKSFTLAANARRKVTLKLSRKLLRRLRRKRRLKVTVSATMRAAVARARTTRRKLTLKAPKKAKKKKRRKKRRSRRGGGNSPGTSTQWKARDSNTGAYDDFSFGLVDGKIKIKAPTLVFVTCFEIGGSYQTNSSFEVFDALGPWTLGQEGKVEKQGHTSNYLVGSGNRTVTYTLSSQRSGNRITGKMKMSFSGGRYNFFTNEFSSVICSGTESWEAVPA